MAELRFRSEAELWPVVDRAFQRHSRTIRLAVPHATVEHVGATAIPGSLTKGDLDLIVRVPAAEFPAAADALAREYAEERRSDDYACFRLEEEGELPLDVHLAVEGSPPAERILEHRRLLRSRPDLVERLNALKLRHEGGSPEAYEAEKRQLLDLERAGDGLDDEPAAEDG